MTSIRLLFAATAALLLASCGGGGGGLPVVSTMSSGVSMLSQSLTINVQGRLLDQGIELVMDGPCVDVTRTGTATTDSVTFRCTVKGLEAMVARVRTSGPGGVQLASLQIAGAKLPRVLVTARYGPVGGPTGSFVVELDPVKAPITVDNFLAYVSAQFYPGTIFHRVIPGFVVQGGGFFFDGNGVLTRKTTGQRAPIKNEAGNGLTHLRGTIAMARTSDPDSATNEFFVNLVDNPSLNPGGVTPEGYAVFGRVVSGQDIVDAIGTAPTSTRGGFEDLPVTAVTILSATQIQ